MIVCNPLLLGEQMCLLWPLCLPVAVTIGMLREAFKLSVIYVLEIQGIFYCFILVLVKYVQTQGVYIISNTSMGSTATSEKCVFT